MKTVTGECGKVRRERGEGGEKEDKQTTHAIIDAKCINFANITV